MNRHRINADLPPTYFEVPHLVDVQVVSIIKTLVALWALVLYPITI